MQAPAAKPPTPQEIEKTTNELAARLLYLQGQEKHIKDEIKKVKAQCEEMYNASLVPAKNDTSLLFSDGSTQKVRLQRVSTGTYFKVEDDHKDDFTAKKRKLEADYLKNGRATMAEKACSWRVEVVKK
jgi:hypothetical protein